MALPYGNTTGTAIILNILRSNCCGLLLLCGGLTKSDQFPLLSPTYLHCPYTPFLWRLQDIFPSQKVIIILRTVSLLKKHHEKDTSNNIADHFSHPSNI